MKNASMVLGLGAAIVSMALYSACSDGSGTPAANTDAGSLATGGSEGAGGDGAGGTTGTDTSAGGSTAADTTPLANAVTINNFTTSADVGAFQTSTYVPTDCGVNVGGTNDAGGTTQLDWSGSVDVDSDATAKGSMKVTATFTDWNQYWEVDMSAPTDDNGDPINLTNKLVTVQFKIASGLSPSASAPYGVVLFVKTGTDYVWGASDWTNIESSGGFVTVTLDATAPQGVPTDAQWDPTAPAQLGIKLGTGGGGESNYCDGDYAAAFGPPLETIAYIDDIKVSDRP